MGDNFPAIFLSLLLCSSKVNNSTAREREINSKLNFGQLCVLAACTKQNILRTTPLGKKRVRRIFIFRAKVLKRHPTYFCSFSNWLYALHNWEFIFWWVYYHLQMVIYPPKNDKSCEIKRLCQSHSNPNKSLKLSLEISLSLKLATTLY